MTSTISKRPAVPAKRYGRKKIINSRKNQPKASAAEPHGNCQGGDDPDGMGDGQNERNIHKPFAIHSADEEACDKNRKKRQGEKTQGK